jgi:D-glycero-alpha-D-manno-heptose-7-phosphate kinase
MQMYYTGNSRDSQSVEKDKLDNLVNSANYLRRMMEIVDEAMEILLDGKADINLPDLGELLDEQWRLKKSLSNLVSNYKIDMCYEAALAAGAYGGKLLGAGGGGFLVFITPQDRQGAVDIAVGMVRVPFQFETLGSQVVYFDNH